MRRRVNLAPGISMVEMGEKGFHTFFGYYEISPFDQSGERLLATRCRAGGHWASAGSPLEIGYYHTSNPSVFHPVTETRAWCWQMGCRLQWLGGGSSDLILFNDTRDGKHVAVIMNVATGEEQDVLPRASYSVSEGRRELLSLNFVRLQRLRPGYGYDDLPDETLEEEMPKNEGVWTVDLDSGEEKLLLSLPDIAAFNPQPGMDGATHYLNHLLWSPDSSQFFFIHLWVDKKGKRYGRGLVWDCASASLLDLGLTQHTSHYWWTKPGEMIIYSSHEDSGTRYHLYDVTSGEHTVLGEGVLTQDGHPSLCPVHESIMLTDTYPNRVREQDLLLFNRAENSVGKIASLYVPVKFTGEFRCDLHPRWNPGGDMVCIDSSHRGERRICLLNLGSAVNALASVKGA